MKETLEGIGLVQYRRNSRARRVVIRMKPNEPIQVTVPSFLPISYARKAVYEKAGWIEKQRRKMDEEFGSSKMFLPGTAYHIKNWVVNFELATRPGRTILKGNKGAYSLLFDPNTDPALPESQALARKALEKVMKLWMQYYVVPKSYERARQHNIPLNRVTIKRTTSQWGSFSTNNNMSLSLFLATIPDHLIEYVVMHELAHYREKNHGPGFWRHLGELVEGARGKDKEMREYVLGKF